MSVEHVHLKPNRALLDQDFEGYKLSVEPSVAKYQTSLPSVLNEVKLSEEFYSVQHVKCFSLHNHLYCDPWNPQQVYYVTDQLIIYQHSSDSIKRSEEARRVFHIPHVLRAEAVAETETAETAVTCYNVSVQFVSEDVVVVSNGCGTVFLVHTGDRKTDNNLWKELFSSCEFGSRRPFLLLDSVLSTKDGSTDIDCLLLRIEDKKNVSETIGSEAEEKSAFVSVLEWITLTTSVDGVWSKSRLSRLQGCGSIDYAAINSVDTSLWIATEKRFHFVYDSQQLIQTNTDSTPSKDGAGAVERKPTYAWKQCSEEVQAWFQLDAKMNRADVDIKMTSNHFCLKLQNTTVLDGQLFAPIEVEASTWIVADGNKLEVTLSKLSQGLMWPQLIKGDEGGEEIIDPQLLEQVHQRLAHLTSDKLNPDPQVQKLGDFNLQQLEECDDFPEHSFSLIRYDRKTLKPTHEVSLSSHNWLFGCQRLLEESVPRLCVRSDVDGLLCIPTDTPPCTLNHLATFNALGYVTASKQDRKFLCCSPDASYAVLCDARKHLYIYFQPQLLDSELRNRKTGQRVKAVAKQKLVTLDNDDIMGLRVTNKSVFVLSRRNIHEVKVIED